MQEKHRKMSLPRLVAIGFATTILVGAILLSLPIASQSGTWTSFIDALFTATSAVCVTGQVTLNTAAHWNYFGKTVIITLIEIGGLSFMAIIVSLLSLLGKKMNVRQRLLLSSTVNADSITEGQVVIRYLIKFSLSIQALGAAVLSLEMIPRYGVLKGIYFSVFHSISAFCNAGFDLFGNSLEGYTQNPIVIVTIGLLIFIGGLGFIVWRDLLSFRKNKKLLMHTKITLITTLSVLLISFILFTVSELQHGTFKDLPLHYQLMNTWFMAITPRTAGYANVNYASISMVGVFATIILMFIGASSGSTGGGVKVTTIASLVLFMRGVIRHEEPRFGNRAIPASKIKDAFMIVVIGASLIFVATLILLFTETIPAGFGIEYILVEVFSCFGTVGLTMGLTPHLSVIGKIVLICMMFSGRIGLLTVFLSMSDRPEQPESKIHYPQGNILVG